jgi:hypothetical protein
MSATVTININRRNISIPADLTPVALSRRNVFCQQFKQAIKGQPTTYSVVNSINISEMTMRRMIERYSEQAVHRPIDDMRYFFQAARRLLTEPGYPPLFYPAIIDNRMGQNLSAISAIGEGVAGLLAHRIYGCSKLARPYRDGVDIVMTSNNITYLIEAKGSASIDEDRWVRNQLDSVYLEDMAREVLSSYGIDIRQVRGLLIGVYLISELIYNCYIIQVDVV